MRCSGKSKAARALVGALLPLANGSTIVRESPPRSEIVDWVLVQPWCFGTAREIMPHLVKTIQLYWRVLSEGALCAGLSNRALDYLYAITVRLYRGEDTCAGF